MSTKRLQRTVIEGGRRNVYERRRSNKDLRVAERAYLSRINQDWETWDEEFEPELAPVMKDFSDKLNPMYRWLEVQVGRPWAEVRSEVFKNFDTRTTAGRHITFDHLLKQVVDTESGFDQYGRIANPNIEVISGKNSHRSFSDYYVDEEGLLQTNEPYGKPWNKPYPSSQELDEVVKWLGSRIIGLKNGRFCWFSPTEGIWKVDWEKAVYGFGGNLKYYYRDNGVYLSKRRVVTSWGNYETSTKHHGDFWNPIEVPFSYRQRNMLSDKDIKYFNSLNERVKKQILAYGENR